MFLLRTKLLKTNSLAVNIKMLPSYGVYRWKKFNDLLNLMFKNKKGKVRKSTLFVTKFFIMKLFSNVEFDKSLPEINKKIKQSIFSYVGLWQILNLPVWGQRTKTNASTQWIIGKQPRKRHFVQKWNWRKFVNKDSKKIDKKVKDAKKN